MRKPLRMRRGPAQNGRAVPFLGVIRKGAQKVIDAKTGREQMGPDLNHFRFVFNDEDESLGAFVESLGEQPNHIRIMLPFPDIASNLQIANDCYKGGILVHRCSVDDSLILTARDLKTYTRTVVNGVDVKTGAAVYCNSEPIYSYTSKKDGLQVPVYCSTVVRFHVMLRDQNRFGTWTVLSGSNEDSYSLRGMLEILLGIIENDPNPQRRKLGLQGIPMILHRGPRKVRYEENGKQHEVEKSLLWIEPDANWGTAAINRMLESSLNMAGAALVSSNGNDDDDEILNLAAGTGAEGKGPDLASLSEYDAGRLLPAYAQSAQAKPESWPTTREAFVAWKDANGFSATDIKAALGETAGEWLRTHGSDYAECAATLWATLRPEPVEEKAEA